jgi:outer membrane lipoprotein-sorting protein/peroxiredoxin
MMIRSFLAALTVAAMVTPALAQQAEDAKATLMESSKAMKEVQGVSFESKRYGTGMLKDFIDCDGKVKMMRPAAGKPLTAMVTGRIKQPGAGDKNLTYKSDGVTAQWLDQKDNKFMERQVADTLAIQEFGLAKQLVPEDYFNNEPYAQVMKMEKLTKLPTDNVKGEACDIIQGATADGTRTITWAISAKDRLPRRMEMATGQGANQLSMILEMSNFDSSKALTAKDFEIPLPTGYIVDKQSPVTPANPGTPGQPAAEIGVAAGTAAPGVMLKDSTGKDLSLEGLKGNVVVLEFFGTMFKASHIGSLDIQGMSTGDFKDKKVKFIGMACREPNDSAAAEYFKTNGLTYTLVPKADAAVADYKIKGFPSYVIVDGTGKVSAFFQTWPGKDVVASEINKALEAK